MTMKVIVVEGKTIDECLDKAIKELKKEKNNLEFEILIEGKKGLFGMMNVPYKIKVWVKNDKKGEKGDSENIDEVLDDLDEIKLDMDGYCEIKRDDKNIYIIIHPPKGEGKRVTVDEAVKFVEENGIINSDFDEIAKAVNRANGEKVKIADFDPAIYQDGDAKIVISKDKMRGEAIIIPPKGGNPVTVERVVDLARREGVKVDIDEDAIKNAIENREYDKPFCIAKGIPPVNGEDARIDYKFKPKKDNIVPKEVEDGKVDFKKLDLINNVTKGEIIGVKIPATTGEAGKNVLGEVVPATPGKDIILTPGKNVKISDNGMRLISEIDGEIVFKKNIVHVYPVHVVNGDVDYSTGDIDFIGCVVVKGSIIEGFTVECEGNLEVYHSISGAFVECNGDVIVRGGILGKEKGSVKAGGNIVAKFIENADCDAKNDVIVEKAIMNSNIKASRVCVRGVNGLIVGGNIQAVDEIESPIIGSELAVKTNLVVGINKDFLEKIKEFEERKSDILRNLEKVNQAIEMLKKIKERSGELSVENIKKLSKTLNLKKQLELNLLEIEEEIMSLEEQIENSKGGRIKAEKIVYPGVIITIKKGTLRVKDCFKYTKFTYEKGYIKVNPYE